MTTPTTSHSHIWIIDDDDSIRWVLQKALENADFSVTSFDNANTILDKLKSESPDAIITDVRMPGIDGLQLLSHLSEDHPDLPVIIMTAHTDLDSAVSAYKGGAFEYLPKPFDIDDAVNVTQRACNKNRSNENNFILENDGSEIIGAAPAMQEVFRTIGRLSKSVISVLITGESGTGKELVALSLHKHSPRATQEFIALNTAAIPKELLESELFGHEKGAFTGAQALRKGRFEQADGGTLFLDEIGDMPAELQTRLLRVLADGVFYRVGGHTPIKVNVRVIAATHQNLEEHVKKGLFREDLFHRLNVIRIQLPALRERKEDIPALLRLFLQRATKELATEKDDAEVKTIDHETMAYLSSLHWSGNVRQLENTCHWLAVMTSGQTVHLSDLPAELLSDNQTDNNEKNNNWEKLLANNVQRLLLSGETEIASAVISEVEEILIRAALQKTNGRKNDAAKLLGWGRNTLTRKIKDFGL
ncbi:Nitrogen regulation protein NR(I), GlnG (=NtrC) [hydrothermal vent metagenome]|uniref:DNA-binding transcriptional regulator NtrC n=1 Tax=hydrothermal vent metagenome TaxID=652676 RepID=A0A3B0W8J4_9ZZZZ